MKKSMLLLAGIACCTSMILWSCSTPTQSVEEAEEVVVEAKQELKDSKQEYLEDVHNFKRIVQAKIESNNKSISDLKAKLKDEKKEVRADAEKKIAALSERNSELKQKIENYEAAGEEQWWEFKTQFNRDMDELVKEFKELTERNI